MTTVSHSTAFPDVNVSATNIRQLGDIAGWYNIYLLCCADVLVKFNSLHKREAHQEIMYSISHVDGRPAHYQWTSFFSCNNFLWVKHFAANIGELGDVAGWYTKATKRLWKKPTSGSRVLVIAPAAQCHFSKQLGRKKWQNVTGLLFQIIIFAMLCRCLSKI